MSGVLKNSLKQCRLNYGLTQEELARRLGICRQTIMAIESGRRAPSITLTLRLAGELSTNVEELFWLATSKPADRFAADYLD